MIKFDFNNDCCGCQLCADRCPQNCITILPNKYGYNIPYVNVDECIECGLCEKICPTLNPTYRHDLSPVVYSAYATDDAVREKGSSGSLFYLLAKNIISEGGIVYGAAFTPDLKVKHVRVDNIEGLHPLMKSKYIQSNTSGIYKKVLDDINHGNKVLFVGTPCQTQAIYNLLKKRKPDNLLLVDFICHGVPSQELFDKSITEWENKHNCKVISFSFREKTDTSLRCFSIKYMQNNNSEIITQKDSPKRFPFYLGYQRYNIFRDSCYNCKFRGTKRVSDITLGDFWFLDKIKPITDFNKGYSMVIINTLQGQNALKSLINDKQIITEEYPLEVAIKYNHAYTKSARRSIVHTLFKHDYSTKPYSYIERHYFGTEFNYLHKLVRIIIRELKL